MRGWWFNDSMPAFIFLWVLECLSLIILIIIKSKQNGVDAILFVKAYNINDMNEKHYIIFLDIDVCSMRLLLLS